MQNKTKGKKPGRLTRCSNLDSVPATVLRLRSHNSSTITSLATGAKQAASSQGESTRLGLTESTTALCLLEGPEGGTGTPLGK